MQLQFFLPVFSRETARVQGLRTTIGRSALSGWRKTSNPDCSMCVFLFYRPSSVFSHHVHPNSIMAGVSGDIPSPCANT